ncbi:MAG: AraC family transcriptional regulator ligand-binding domain-containing protein [Deltaproteobacteria bacterium]|nr:AraC family transcriptional regulator ligand-binding domain-containing protein [Deltaproteobacteria bacterium]
MQPEPTVCVKAIRAAFFAAAARTGRPMPELAAEVGVDVAILGDTAARVPHTLVIRVWETFAARCADPAFGLTAAAIVGVPRIDSIDYVLQRSGTMRELIARFLRYQRLFHDANASTIVQLDDTCAMRHRFGGDLARSRHFTEFILAIWIGRMRSLQLAGIVRAVTLCHAAPAARDAHARAYGDVVQFDAEHDGLVFGRAFLDAPLPESAPGLVQSLEAQLARELAELPGGTSFPDEVRAAIARLIREGEPCEIDACARALAMSARTLQRRLGKDGTTFRELVDLARRDIALQKIVQPSASVTDLAFLLGFSEASAFSRAFRRWTGKSPTEYLRR